MMAHPLDRILNPASIALIGASDQPDSLGTAFTRQLLSSGFAGQVHLVNPRRAQVFDRACLPSVRDLPVDVDLALVLTPWSSVTDVINQLARRRCGGAVIVGIATESGWPWASRAALLKRLRQQVARSGLRIIGPASQGLTLARLGINLSLCPALPPPGGIGFVSASGAVAGVIADWAAQRGVGMSALISLGDSVDLDAADCLDWFARDPGTRAVLMHVEHLDAARRLLSAARALAFRKPLVILKPHAAGREPGDPAARLSDRVHSAAFARAGMLQAHDLEEFCAAANVDLPAWPHAGARFAILANGPALGALAADAVAASGGLLAQAGDDTLRKLRPLLPPRAAIGNPLDLMRDAGPDRYAGAVSALAADPGIDVVLLLHHPTSFSDGREVAAALQAVGAGQALVLAAFAGAEQQLARRTLAERGIAAFSTPEAAVRAYDLNRRYFRQKSELMQTPPALLRWPQLDDERIQQVLSQRFADPDRQGRALLAAAGIDVAPQSAQASGARIGLRCHAELGPFAIAEDGTHQHVECLPLDRLRVDRLIDSGWATGRADADLRATLQGHLLLMADMVLQQPQIRQLELSAVELAMSGEILAHVQLQLDSAATRPAPAFAPYPGELAVALTLNDGQTLLLRPIRAEDEPALQLGFTQLSPDEVRMRFLHPLKALTHDLAARLTQLDYDREIALVLADEQPPGQARLFGVVRASLDAGLGSAEFAIVIPHALSGQGLGTRLLGRIIELTRRAGVRLLYGDTLPENSAMRALARKFGFHEELRDHLIRITLPL